MAPVEERQYHNTSSSYVLPNDATEHVRLDTQAAAIVEMLGGTPFLGISDISIPVSKAVDVGCGTGIATVQMGHIFPSAKVWGLDLSPVPDIALEVAPSNVEWTVGNVLKVDIAVADDNDNSLNKIFAHNSLHYVFGRMLFLGITDWPRYFSTAARAMKTGGVIEHQDMDWGFCRHGTSERLSDHWEWHQGLLAAVEKSGLARFPGSSAAPAMKDAGFEIISIQTYEFSFVYTSEVPNSKAAAEYARTQFLPNFPELIRKMLGLLGIQGEKLQSLIDDALRDVMSEEGLHMRYTVTVARKP